MDLDVSLVLLAKRFVLSARKGLDADDVTKELYPMYIEEENQLRISRDKSLKQILEAFGERSAATHRFELTHVLQQLPRKYVIAADRDALLI